MRVYKFYVSGRSCILNFRIKHNSAHRSISIRCVPISVSNLYTWMSIRSRTCIAWEWHKPQEIVSLGHIVFAKSISLRTIASSGFSRLCKREQVRLPVGVERNFQGIKISSILRRYKISSIKRDTQQ